MEMMKRAQKTPLAKTTLTRRPRSTVASAVARINQRTIHWQHGNTITKVPCPTIQSHTNERSQETRNSQDQNHPLTAQPSLRGMNRWMKRNIEKKRRENLKENFLFRIQWMIRAEHPSAISFLIFIYFFLIFLVKLFLFSIIDELFNSF